MNVTHSYIEGKRYIYKPTLNYILLRIYLNITNDALFVRPYPLRPYPYSVYTIL